MDTSSVQDWSLQCPSNAIQPFKIHLSQNNPSKRNPKLKIKTSLEVLNVICPSQEPTNKRRASSLQEEELDSWFLILHSVLETCTIKFMHKCYMSYVFHFYILGLMSWIWTNPSIERLKFENPSKWNWYEGFNLEHWTQVSSEHMRKEGISGWMRVQI
jgi:hypothetical protein